mgnify:FL=1
MWGEARKSLILCGKMAFPVKWGIYFINVFRGRDRQKLPPVKYEKVYFVPGLLSCYALQDTGKMCRNIVFDVKKL